MILFIMFFIFINCQGDVYKNAKIKLEKGDYYFEMGNYYNNIFFITGKKQY